MTMDRATLLNQCFQEVEVRAPQLLKRCLETVNGSLQAAADASLSNQQRQVFERATVKLAQSRNLLIQSYPLRLRAAFELQSGDSGSSTTMGLFDSSMMQLVDDTAMNETLESARLLQNMLPLVERALPVLDARMSSLIGLETVDVEKNPLRPSVFARELRDLLAEVEGDSEIRVLWMQHMVHVLGRELTQLYESLALLLQRANVQEASYRIRLALDPEASQAAGVSDSASMDLASTHASHGRFGSGGGEHSPFPDMRSLAGPSSDLDGSVFHSFLSGPKGAYEQALDQSFFDQIRSELSQIQALSELPSLDDGFTGQAVTRYRALPSVERPSREVSVDTVLASSQWGEFRQAHSRTRVLLELKARAEDASQAIGLDLVRKLVDQVARDPLLLAPVREAVVAFEPALLRLALSNPRYFGDADHPARLMVEEVAQRSFRFNDEFAEDFLAFLDPVCIAITALNSSEAEESGPFLRVLNQLRQGWKDADAADLMARDEQLNALKYAEARQQLADEISWEISLRPDVYNAPALVLDFFYGTWSLVIASAQMQPVPGKPDAQAYRAAMGALLWSVRPEVMLRQAKAVFESLPSLLQCLQAGLSAIGMPQADRQPFFDGLMKLHRPLLRLRRVRVAGDVTSQLSQLEEEMGVLEPVKRVQSNAPRRVATAQPWMASKEWADAGFEETQPVYREGDDEPDAPIEEVDTSEATHAPASPGSASQANSIKDATEQHGAAGVVAVVAQLHQGSMVDLYSKGEWIRAELAWVSAKGTLFMFSSAGGRAHSMTLRSCEKLIQNRWLRLVETRAVVQAAVQELTQGNGGNARKGDKGQRSSAHRKRVAEV